MQTACKCPQWIQVDKVSVLMTLGKKSQIRCSFALPHHWSRRSMAATPSLH